MSRWDRYSGSGNTFVLHHDPDHLFDDGSGDEVRSICEKCDVDGLIVVKPSSLADCRMVYMNRDGSRGAMCGNALRCTAHFVLSMIFPSLKEISIETDRGVHRGTAKRDLVMVEVSPIPILKPIFLAKEKLEGVLTDTGVPHLLVPVQSVSNIDVDGLGRKLRYHKAFEPEGVNVTFVEYRKDLLGVRTYERGVEAETGSCGTGMVAAGALFFHLYPKQKKVLVCPTSCEKLIVYTKKGQLFLEGKVKIL